MTYTTHTWVEQAGSEADRVGYLNNLETIYDEALTYLTTFDHTSTYYTKTECDAKYFSASTDGAGSGLVCEKLDGRTVDEVINAGTPAGCIAIWHGSDASIPAGWEACTYLNSRFIVGAGGQYAVGATGGSSTATTYATVTIAGHSLTAAETPAHTHGAIPDYYPNASGESFSSSSPPGEVTYVEEITSRTDYAGSGTAHNHAASFAGTSNQDIRPPYYALRYIIKVEV